jgi:predicted ArsR family transcriptional regulator
VTPHPSITHAYTAPAYGRSLTSFEAAKAIREAAPNLRARVLGYIEKHGPVTDEAIAAGTGLNPSTARPRRIELYRLGLIEKAGIGRTTAGRSAVLWRGVPKPLTSRAVPLLSEEAS